MGRQWRFGDSFVTPVEEEKTDAACESCKQGMLRTKDGIRK